MNENKRLLMIFGVIALVVVIILLISFWPKPDKTFMCGVKADGDYDKLGKVNYKQYQCLYESDSKNPIVVADELSSKDKKQLNEAAKKIGHAIYYIDTEKVSKDDLKAIKKELKYNDNSFKKDVILVLQDEDVVAYKEDFMKDKDELYNFLKEAKLAKFACEVSVSEEYDNLGEITYEQYQCLYESEEPFALILAQTTCSYCLQFKPIINAYAEDKDLPVYVIEIDQLSDNDRSELLSSLSNFDGNYSWGTPLTLGIKNKEVISDLSGFTEDEGALDDFFEKLDIK